MSDNQDPIAAALDKCLRDKVAVAISAADSSAKHYEDYYKSFLGIDTKAQSNATISGLVLAATAAFIKDGRVTALAQSGRWWIVLVLLPPAFALLAVIVSLVGARITSIIFPFDAKEQIREAKHLADLDCNEFSQMHIRNYYSRSAPRALGEGARRYRKESCHKSAMGAEWSEVYDCFSFVPFYSFHCGALQVIDLSARRN